MTSSAEQIRRNKQQRNIQGLKLNNLASVLRALALGYAQSRTELATYLNLSKMAISNLVAELIHDNYVSETTINDPTLQTSPNGRKPKKLVLNDWKLVSICVHIYRYKISYLLMDIKGNYKGYTTQEIPSSATNDVLGALIVEKITDLLAKIPPIMKVCGIGIASIGPLDIYHKAILNPPDFYNIKNFNIGDLLSSHFHLPIFLDNDMNCSALAEVMYGSGKNQRDLVFLGFSSGVGAGVIMNDKIVHGSGGFAGEVGHFSINPRGRICPCGQRGCVELYTSGENLLKNSGLSTFNQLNSLLDAKEPPVYILNVIQEFIELMKSLMVAIANFYDPNIIVLGDINSQFISRYIKEIEEYMNTHMLMHGYKEIQLILSSQERVQLLGAGSLVFLQIMDGTLMIPQKDR